MLDRIEETYIPSQFQAGIGYKERERSPQVVCAQTHTLMELMLGGVLSPKSTFVRDYIGGYTGSYLDSVVAGFFLATNYRAGIDRYTMAEIFRRRKDFSREDGVEEIEAFKHSVVVFGHMKSTESKGVYFDKSAPVTVGDFFVRLDELRRVNDGFAKAKISLERPDRADSAVRRSLLYFQVSQNIPFRNTASTAQEQRDGINNLLKDIDLSL